MSLDPDLNSLDHQLAAAQYFRASDGQVVNMAKFNHAKGMIARYPEAEQQAIREQYRHYKSLQGQRGAIIRRQNKAQLKEGETQGHFLDARRDELVALFAKFCDAKSVHAEVLKLGIQASYDVVRKWGTRNEQHIVEAQRIARESLHDLRFSHKRGRVEVLHDLFRDRSAIYQMTKSREDHKLLMQTLEQMKREVDGDFAGKIDLTLDVQATAQHALHQSAMQRLNLLYVVLARVAGARGQDPAWLMSKLTTGYYAQLNGYINPESAAQALGEEFVFPSERPYDYDAIKRKDAERVQNLQQEREQSQLDNRRHEPAKVEKAADLKQLMLAALQQQLQQASK